MSLLERIDISKLPVHIAIIMDGNGRWAKKQNKPRVFGHQSGASAVKRTIEGSAELGIKYLTLYAFSAENWNRPKTEVEALMSLLVSTIDKELNNLIKNNIRFDVIGNLSLLPASVKRKVDFAIEKTNRCTGMLLTLALSYGGRWEITNAVKKIAEDAAKGLLNPQDITGKIFATYLTTANMPDPELLIRTSGELRLSNFLLWQSAYTELYFTDVMWPDFNKEELYKAVLSFQNRERRFGKTTEQL
ncbi:MAG: isoprenyl transferase [Bacteroidales bacterium]|nr:isoprenyl transferase [Bacteroidales bacterium]MDD4673332.1 isoprenyl transferase [Bacteroidales bacterium]MDY0349300.1 isoprenyl transferase [Tenuifilaceae bacterium]